MGLLGSARSALALVVEIAQTRLQLAATELEEERLRIAELLIYAVAALFCLGLGLVLGSVLLVLLLWDGPRWLVLGLETAFFLSVGAGLAAGWRRKAGRGHKFLASTLTELERDREAIQSGTARVPRL